MMMPSVFGESLFDDLMDFPFDKEFFGHRNPLYGKHAQNVMKTDIKESDTAYEMDIDLPGFKKEDVSAKLEKKADNVKVTGEVRFRYVNQDGAMSKSEREAGDANSYSAVWGNKSNHVADIRSRIWINGMINDDWTYTGMLQHVQKLNNNTRD